MLIIVLALILSACGKGPSVVLDTELATAFTNAETSLGAKIDGITVRFGNVGKEHVVAVCNSSLFGSEIVVNQSKWNTFNQVEQEIIMLHEIGHCYFGKHHDESWINFSDNTCPASVMNLQRVRPECYSNHKDHYLNNLKN